MMSNDAYEAKRDAKWAHGRIQVLEEEIEALQERIEALKVDRDKWKARAEAGER